MPTLLSKKSNLERLMRKQGWNVSWSWWYISRNKSNSPFCLIHSRKMSHIQKRWCLLMRRRLFCNRKRFVLAYYCQIFQPCVCVSSRCVHCVQPCVDCVTCVTLLYAHAQNPHHLRKITACARICTYFHQYRTPRINTQVKNNRKLAITNTSLLTYWYLNVINVNITAELGRALVVIKVTLQVNGNSQFLGIRPKNIGAIKIILAQTISLRRGREPTCKIW